MNTASMTLKERLPIYGQWTYRGAWSLEIAAALIGIATGVVLGVQSFANSTTGSVGYTELALATSPFLMVAIAELTKIPIATLLYSARWIWKPVILVFLVALAGINFETVFMGLERSAALRQLRYEETVRQIDGLGIERDRLSGAIGAAGQKDVLGEAQADLERISVQADTERQKINVQIEEATKELSGAGFVSAEAARLKDRITALEANRQKIVDERDGRISRDVVQFESQRDSFVKRIEIATQNGDRAGKRNSERQLADLKNPRPAIEKEYAPKIAAIDEQTTPLRAELDKEMSSSSGIGADQRAAVEKRIELLRKQLADFDAGIAQQKTDAQGRIAEAQQRQRQHADNAEEAAKQRSAVEEQIATLEKQRVENARTDQIRRIAARVYGVKPEQVNEEQAGFIALVWFGSLAALAAMAGPVTAMVALALQNVRDAAISARPSPLSRLVRRMLLSWRWRRVRSVQVNVEVPVDREVEKRIEVPVEKVVKEILYVPVLTNDPEAVRNSITQTMPKEVANLVSVSMAKGR